VIVLAGAFVVNWTVGLPLKFWSIAVASTLVSILIYELAIRRISVLRFIFGMKPKHKQAVDFAGGELKESQEPVVRQH
jgi:hypothetical protein